MAVARWMIPNKSLRLGRPNRSKPGNDEDFYKLDPNRNPKENALCILEALCTKAQDTTFPFKVSSASFEEEPYSDKEQNKSRKITDGKRLSYLNAFVKLLSKDELRVSIGFTTEELLCCLRICLVHETSHVRAAALRVVRYILRTEADIITFNTLRLPYLISRSLDIVLRNEVERAQALRVIRRVLVIAPTRISPALVRCLSSIAGGTGMAALASGSSAEGAADRLSRACVATLAEIGVVNTPALAWCGGAAALARYASSCDQPHMAEAACGVLLHALESRSTRRVARVDLRCLAAPYADFHDRAPLPDKNRDEREMRFTCSRLSLLCVLRSWPGVLHFCHPLHHSGLRALVDVLYLHQLEVRNAVLDLLYELLGLPQPEWTDEMSVALAAVDPSDFQDSWRLNEGFIVSEGLSILPHLSATGPDITEIHMALLLYCFLESGLLDALVEVIVTSDTFISVRATVLLGQLLYLIHLLLPPDVCSVTPALPSLLAHAAEGKHQALAAVAALQNLHSMLEARPACNSLFLNHVIQYCAEMFILAKSDSADVQSVGPKSDRPKGSHGYQDDSFDLLNDADYEAEEAQRRSFGSRNDYSSRNESALVKSKSVSSRTSAVVSKVAKSTKLFNLFDKECDNLIRDSNVLQTKDGFAWDWCVVRAILKRNVVRWNEYGSWWRCIVTYLRPSSNQFSHADATTHPRDATLAVLEIVPTLHADSHPECRLLLRELFDDIVSALEALLVARSAHECLFSPQHMTNTMCQMYFLIIAQLCHDALGLQLFYDIGLYTKLMKLATTTHHSCYVKLIISSLDYTIDSYPRQIMSETLRCIIEPSRLYATQFLNVLLRARQKAGEITKKKVFKVENISQTAKKPSYNGDVNMTSSNQDPQTVCSSMDSWVLDMLIKQAADESKAVSRCALSALEEACNIKAYLDHLVPHRSKIRSLFFKNKDILNKPTGALTGGDRAYLLWLRLATTPQAFDEQEISHELTFWVNSYNSRYARLVESGAHAALTLGAVRGGATAGRGGGEASTSASRGVGVRGAVGGKPARVPVHLYALLSASPVAEAPALLQRYGTLPQLVQCVEQGQCDTVMAATKLKGAIWATCAAVAGGGSVVSTSLNAGGSNTENRCGLNEVNVTVATVRLMRTCGRYSVRAAALHALGMLASVRHSADILQRIGWLSVRHTRHDRFPIIQDDNWYISRSEEDLYSDLPTKGNDRVVIETEISETSDKTDQSNADSTDSHRHESRLVTSSTIEHSMTEERCGICETTEEQLYTVSKVDRLIVDNCDKTEKRAKCQTLPQRLYTGSKLHQRSLSESKTVDRFKTDDDTSHLVYERSFHIGAISENRPMVGRMNSFDQWHDGLRRIRNNSESSTSGVSSCDSVYGKYMFNDRVLTLSPIPSSSSLSGMKGAAPRRRQPEGQRRISLQSYAGSDVASSPPSQKDLAGYATLKSLSRHRRPHSESEAKAVDDFNAFLSGEARRPSTATVSSAQSAFASLRERRQQVHTSLLKYDWKPLTTPDLSSSGIRTVAPISSTEAQVSEKARPVKPQLPNVYQGFCYIGICMPRRLLDIFPDDDDDLDDDMDCMLGDNSLTLDISGTSLGTKVAMNADEVKGPDILETYRRETEDSTLDSSMSDVSGGAPARNISSVGAGAVPAILSSNKQRRRWRHDAPACLLCCRNKPASTAELREAFFAGMDTSKSNTDRSSTAKSPTEGMSNLLPDTSCGSPGSVDSNASKFSDIGGNPAVIGEIMKHSERMGNPVWHKQSKQTLLSLKQKHPDSFQSICLYSEVCKLMTMNTYRVSARRFLQELFFDLNFDIFFGEPKVILQMKTASGSAE